MSDSIWRARPVFITSTFRDMHAERDYLRDWVFPVIDERLRERREYLEPIDLRQGVETLSEPDQHARELQVLKVCLDEVRRSRPFLIGLLGDRYGWIPPEARIRAAAIEAGFEGEVAGRSVTELEIAYGVLADPAQRQRSLFYFREPLPYDDMPKEFASQYSERHNNEKTATAAKNHLDAFKAKIKKRLPDRWRSYEAQWDRERSKVVGLEAWGEQVIEDLWRELDAETRESSREAPATWQGAERWVLEQFIEERSRTFTGRSAVLGELVDFATAAETQDTDWGLCLTGSAGSGKSAVFAELHHRLGYEDFDNSEKTSNVLLLSHSAGISTRGVRVDDMLARWVDELSEHLRVPNPLDDTPKSDDIERVLGQLLSQASVRWRVVLVVDALDQLEHTTRAQQLLWLPKLWPPNVRFIATALPGTASTFFTARSGVSVRELDPLTENDASEIAEAIYARYHRSLNDEVRRALLGKVTKDGQPAWGNPLWLEIAVEALNQLDEDDYVLADKDFAAEDPARRLHLLVLDAVGSIPGDVKNSYAWVLERAERLHGMAWTGAFVNLIAISRSGWREQDFAAVIPRITGNDWDALTFAAIRRTLRGHIVQRGSQTQWQFSHAQMREAVVARNLGDPDSVRALHATVALHLKQLASDDPLHEWETMSHLIGANDRIGVAKYYGAELTDGEVAGATDAISEVALQSYEDRDSASTLSWITSVLAMAERPFSERYMLCRRFITDLDNNLERYGAVESRLTVLEAAERGFHDLLAVEPNDADCQRGLLIALRRCGDVYVRQARHLAAMEKFRSALDVCATLTSQGSADSVIRNDHAAILTAVSAAHRELGDDIAAQETSELAVTIASELAAEDPMHEPLLLVCKIQLLDSVIQKGELSKALQFLEETRAFAMRLVDTDPCSRDATIGLFHLDFRLVNLLAKQGDFKRALTANEDSIAALERLVARDAVDIDLQALMSNFLETRAQIFVETQKYSLAVDAYRASLAVADHIAGIDPTNVAWQLKVPRLLEMLSRSLFLQESTKQGIASGCIEACSSAMSKMESLIESSPDNSEWRDYLSNLRELMEILWRSASDLTLGETDQLALADNTVYASDLVRWQAKAFAEKDAASPDAQLHMCNEEVRSAEESEKRGDAVRALEHYEAALTIREELLAANPNDSDQAVSTAALRIKVGDLCLSQNNVDRAVHMFSSSRSAYSVLATKNRDDWTLHHNVALCHARVGKCRAIQGRFAEALTSFVSAIRPENNVGFDPTDQRMIGNLSDNRAGIGFVIDQLRHSRVSDDELAGFRANEEAVMCVLDCDPGNSEFQKALGTAQMAVGIALGTRNEVMESLLELNAAAKVTTDLVNADPSDLGLQVSLSALRAHISVNLERQGDLEGALSSYRESESISQRLAEADPENQQLQLNVAIALASVARLVGELGDPAAALIEWQAGEAVARKIVDGAPSNALARQLLVNMTFNIGELQAGLGDIAEAIRAYKECEALAHPPGSDTSTDPQTKTFSAVAGNRLGAMLCAQGNYDAALVHYRTSEHVFDQLANEDSGNILLHQHLGETRTGIGVALEGRGDAKGAIRAYQSSAQILGRLAEESPANASLLEATVRTYSGMASALETDGQLQSALESFDNMHELSRRLIHIDQVNPEYQRFLFVAQWRTANLLDQLQRAEEAMTWWRQACSSLECIVEKSTEPTTEDIEQLNWLRARVAQPRQ